MAKLTGIALGGGTATSPDGQRVGFTLVKLVKSVPSLQTLAAENKRWRETAASLRPKGHAIATRAQFADDVMAVAIENTRLGVGDVIAAQETAGSGRLLGIATYIVDAKKRAGYLGLLATAPEFVPGAMPPASQLRGIGTSLVAAVSQDMLSRGVETVFLHPLDHEASRFWGGRGFVICGLGNLLCVRGRAAIERLRGHCELTPDDGGCLSCGEPHRITHVAVPVAGLSR